MEEEIKEYAKELRTLILKSHDSFEKQLNFISAGTLGLSMIIVEKLINNLQASSNKWMLILSWMLLGCTLISNLLSHIFTANVHGETLSEIDDKKYSYLNATSRNKKINLWNFISVVFMIFGIIFLIIFISINI